MRLIWKTLFRLTVISRLNFLHSVGPRLASSCVRETQKTMRTQEGGWTGQINSSRSGGHDVTSVMVFEDFSMVALLKSVRAWLLRTFTPLHTSLSHPHRRCYFQYKQVHKTKTSSQHTHGERKRERREKDCRCHRSAITLKIPVMRGQTSPSCTAAPCTVSPVVCWQVEASLTQCPIFGDPD